MRIVWIHNAGQTKVPDLQDQVLRVDKQVGRLEIAVQHVGRVDVLEAPEELVHEQPGMVLRQKAPLQQLTQVCLHVLLHNVDRVDLCQRHHILRQPPSVGAQRLKHLERQVVSVSRQFIPKLEIHFFYLTPESQYKGSPPSGSYLHDVVVVEASNDLDFAQGMLHTLGVRQDNFLHSDTLVTVRVDRGEHQAVPPVAQRLQVHVARTQVKAVDVHQRLKLLRHGDCFRLSHQDCANSEGLVFGPFLVQD